MRTIATAAALMLLAGPAFAQQQQSPPILDTLNRALGNQPQDNRSYDDYRQSANRDQQLPRDQQGRVDIQRLSDRDLEDYDQRLNDRGRYIASELRDTQAEMQRRGLSGSSGSSRGDTQRRR